jgi:thymidylate kinase
VPKSEAHELAIGAGGPALLEVNSHPVWSAPPTPSAGMLTLPIIETVLTDFSQHNISYCYWKSRRRLYSVLTAERDLDLLVAAHDQHRAEAILLARDFKLFPAMANRDHPSLLSFLGYDESSGRLVHAHLHLRLVVGQQLFKDYHLPWEDVVLARAVSHSSLPIRMLDPAMEALLLAVRDALEVSRLDAVALRNWDATTRKFALDRIHIAARVDPIALRDLATELLDEKLGRMVVDVIKADRPLEQQHRFRRQLARHLAINRAYNPLEARLRGAWRTVLWMVGNMNRHVLHLPRPWSRRAPGGGRVVAIVGVDGSGKTTVTTAIREWLGSEIDVLPIYFGTGDGRPSLILRPFKLMVPLMRRIIGTKPKGASHGKISNRAPGPLYSALMMMWALIVAHEKRGKLLAARRGADRGLIVVTDRYPQDEIVEFNDGPLLSRLSSVPNRLRRLEASAYALSHRLRPDLVIKLDVLPETAARREPDMDPALIDRRVADLRRLTFRGARVITVDAEQPLKDVIRAVKREIWRLL